MLTFRLVLATGVAPLVVAPLVEAVELEPVELVEVLEPLDVDTLVVEAVELEPVEGEAGALLEPLLLDVLEDVLVVVDPPLLASTLVTTNASAANDTCLELNRAIWPEVAP
jgi:hypothetical protein